MEAQRILSPFLIHENKCLSDILLDRLRVRADSFVSFEAILATPLQGGRPSRLTIIPWFTERPRPHHAFWPVSQGHTAAQGRGSIELTGRVTGGSYAVGARYPRGATGNWGNYHKRELFGKTVSGTDETVGCRETCRHTHTAHLGIASLF